MGEGIYDKIMQEVKDRNTYKYDVYEPYFVASYVIHNFNLHNQAKHVYYVDGDIQNARLHLLLVAPPGSMKSHFLNLNSGSEYSIFGHTRTKMVRKQSMSEAGFVGSVSNNKGESYKKEGIAEMHQNSIVTIDEFSALVNALKSQHNNQFESQLLAALDHGYINKDLAGGDPIEYKTKLTTWSGIQPARIDMGGGMGRRFCYLVATPTENDNKMLRKIMHDNRGVKPNISEMRDLWNDIKIFDSEIKNITEIKFTDDILDFYDKNSIYSYETSYYDRIILGYTLAKYGAHPKVECNLDGNELLNILKQQVVWRKNIFTGVDYVIIQKVLMENKNVMPLPLLVDKCRMYGWNLPEVHKKLKEMHENKMIKLTNNNVELKV